MAIKVDIGPVLWAGRELMVEQQVPVPDFMSYVFPEQARVSLEIRRCDRELDVTGAIDTVYAGACDRCLGDARHALHIDVEERFATGADTPDPFAESNVLNGSVLDVSDLVRQLIDSALPLTMLCSEECPGIREASPLVLETTWPI